MVLLPKLRQQILVSLSQAFRMHRFIGNQPAWAVAATRPVTRRDLERGSGARPLKVRRLKVHHLRLLFGLACLLLLLALLLTQPAGTGRAPYLTYDKISADQPASMRIEPPQAGTAPCSILTAALGRCEP